MEYAVAVIDIGMTNKKVAVYDERLNPLDAAYETFAPLEIESAAEGKKIFAHDIESMRVWFFERIKEFAKKFPIKAIAVTTHGATFVCVGEDGKPCAPCVFYTEEPGEEFQNEFYHSTSERIALQKSTRSPAFGSLLNVAKGIFYLQKFFPDEFSRTKTILFYPQYWGFALTGNTGAEPTYAACHTCLWDHEKKTWSPVVDALGVRGKMPAAIKNAGEILGTLKGDVADALGLPRSTVVTMGVHDSNASLLPYLASESASDFVLNSTGSWCVAMHPQKSLEFNDEDLGKIVFFNQSALGGPVKTAIFVGGMEFDAWTALYKKINGASEFPLHTDETVNALLAARDTFLLPELVSGSGQFTGSRPGIMERGAFYPYEKIKDGSRVPRVIRDERAFIAALEASLVIQTETALRRAGLKDGAKVFTEGGFRKNALYNSLLPTVLPKNETFRTSMAEATSVGAAMTAVMAFTGKRADELSASIKIERTLDKPRAFFGYGEYKREWLKIAESRG